jgi:hypothetical protein
LADDLQNPWKFVNPWDLNPTDMSFDPVGYFQGLGGAMGIGQTPTPPPLPVQQQEPQTVSPNQGSGMGNLGDWAAILGGLGLGIAAPHVGPQALQNFSAINLMQNRQDQRREAQERIDLYKQAEKRHMETTLAAQGIEIPGMDPALAQAARQEAERTARVQEAFFNDGMPQGPQSMQARQPQAPAMPQAPGTPQYTPVSTGEAPASSEPLRNIDPSQGPPRLEATAPASEFVFPSDPRIAPTSTTKSLTHRGMTITKNQPTIDPKQFDTQQAVAELSELIATQDDAVANNPRQAFRTIMKRHSQADAKEVKHQLSDVMINAHMQHLTETDPGLDPITAYRHAYSAAAKDMGLLFSPTDQARNQSLGIATIEQQRANSIGQPGGRAIQNELNTIEAAREAALTGAKNTANFYTEVLPPSSLQHFEDPPKFGGTGAQIAGKAPMSKERETGITTRERERSQLQVTMEHSAPTVQAVATKAQELRTQFDRISKMGIIGQGANWADYMQSQATGMPMTEFGKAAKTYDDFVATSGPMVARAVQSQVGNLTEMEQQVARKGLPQTFREIHNNPVEANERMAVLGDAISMKLRDPNFRLPRLNPDSPLSPFEQHVEQARTQRIATRPDLYNAIAQQLAPPPVAPQAPQAPGAPPSVPSHILSPQEQADLDKINADIQNSINKKKR